MVRSVVIVACSLALVACTSPDDTAISPREAYVRDARALLPDAELVEATPSGFEVERVVVNDREYAQHGWVTIGVRLGEWPAFARAIFYVLPDETAAEDLYQRQRRLTVQRWKSEKRDPRFLPGRPPEPFSLASIAVPNLCGVRESGLYWCHAVRGRVYLLIQSGTSTSPFSGSYPPEGKEKVFSLMRSFGSYLSTI